MSFWDTVMGHRLAETLTHCLPKIVEAVNNKPTRPEQNMAQMPAAKVPEYLRTELSSGRRLVQAIPIPTDNGTDYVVVTE